MVGNWSSSASSMTTKRYPGYKGQPGGVDQIVFKFYSNQHTAYNDVLAGNLDMAGIGQDQYAEAKAKFGARFIAFSAPAIDYMAKDFTSFRQLMLERMALTIPGWI